MKKMMFLLLLMLTASATNAQTNYVHVGKAGTLQKILEQKGYMGSEGLVIAGELNGRDIAVLRALTGSKFYFEYDEAAGLPSVNIPKLKYINLYDARIVYGTLPFRNGINDLDGYSPHWVYKWYHTSNDVISRWMFCPYIKSTITDFVTPSSVKNIDYAAFCWCDDMITAYISEGTEIIGDGAFTAKNLKRVVLPATLQSIGENCFGSAKDLQSIYCLATTPPEFAQNTSYSYLNSENHLPPFSGQAYNNCKLYVPDGCGDAYMNSEWGAFANIIETADMESLFADLKPSHIDIPADMVEEEPGAVYKVCLEEPGTLQQVLEEKGMTDAEKLILGGQVNGRDILYLRILGGLRTDFQVQDYTYMNENGFPEKPGTKLNRIDLYDARIVSGGGPYLMDDNHSHNNMELWRYTDDDVAGEGLFEGEWRLQEIILPSTTKRMEKQVFFGNISMEGTYFVPDGVESIGYGAFYACRELEQVVLPASLNSMGRQMFWMCDKLHTIYSLNPTPPAIENTYKMFTEFILNEGQLIVPAGCAQAYRNAYGWSIFKNIMEADDIEAQVAPYKPQHHDFSVPTAVAPVSAYEDGTGTQVFNLNGMRLTQPARGLNIIRMEDGNVRKVMK